MPYSNPVLEHATPLDIFSIGIPKQVIKDRLKNVDPSELYTMESTRPIPEIVIKWRRDRHRRDW